MSVASPESRSTEPVHTKYGGNRDADSTPTTTNDEQGSPVDEVRQKAEETATTLVDQAQQVASVQANNQMTRAASLLDDVAQSLSETSSGMRDQQPQIASLADQAATRVEGCPPISATTT